MLIFVAIIVKRNLHRVNTSSNVGIITFQYFTDLYTHTMSESGGKDPGWNIIIWGTAYKCISFKIISEFSLKLEMLQFLASEWPRYMPKAAAIHYLNVCRTGRSRSRSAKKQRLQSSLTSSILQTMNILDQVIAVLEQKNLKVGRGVLTFYKSQGHICHLLSKAIPSCVTVYYHITVAAIVSEISAFKDLSWNVCYSYKNRPRSSKVTLMQCYY